MKLLRIILAAATLAAATSIAVAQDNARRTGRQRGPERRSHYYRHASQGPHRDRVVGADRRPGGSDLAVQSHLHMLDTLSNMVPSFIVGQNSISDASSFVRSPSLRGLPADEMLVMLMQGAMNRHPHSCSVYQGGETSCLRLAGPDLASIPSIAVKSLEILRDGASAVRVGHW